MMGRSGARGAVVPLLARGGSLVHLGDLESARLYSDLQALERRIGVGGLGWMV